MGGRSKSTAEALADALAALAAATDARRHAAIGTKAYEEALAREERASKRVMELARDIDVSKRPKP
jgi:predicted metal-dependent TIM-barrel fold hydrolase